MIIILICQFQYLSIVGRDILVSLWHCAFVPCGYFFAILLLNVLLCFAITRTVS